MRVAYDHQIFSSQVYGGISRYFFRLAENLGADSNVDASIVAPLYVNQYIRHCKSVRVIGYPIPKIPRGNGIIQVVTGLVARRILRAEKPDVTHETCYSSRRSGPRCCPTVITVYDMIHEIFNDQFPVGDVTSRLKRVAVERADHVICISENTRQDLIRLFGIPEERVSVVYLGFEYFERPEGAHLSLKRPMQSPYLLYVGQRGGYKNFQGFLRAVASTSHLMSEFDVVAFGGNRFSASELDLIRSLGFRKDQVNQINGNDTVLGQLYEHARVFVYPSLYEGFGMPLLEAMAHNCPVVSSNTSSIPEVVDGNSVEFFDPQNIDDMARAIEGVVYDESRIDALIKGGRERLNHFSWKRCATDTMSVYRRVVG